MICLLIWPFISQTLCNATDPNQPAAEQFHIAVPQVELSGNKPARLGDRGRQIQSVREVAMNHCRVSGVLQKPHGVS